jgi:hypothetical protein
VPWIPRISHGMTGEGKRRAAVDSRIKSASDD